MYVPSLVVSYERMYVLCMYCAGLGWFLGSGSIILLATAAAAAAAAAGDSTS